MKRREHGRLRRDTAGRHLDGPSEHAEQSVLAGGGLPPPARRGINARATSQRGLKPNKRKAGN
nr:MAG TPA: hypothetical protein [Bacteriophage sp.]